MKYIKRERFLLIDDKIKEMIIDNWEPTIGDLFYWINDEELHNNKVECCTSDNVVERTKDFKGIKNNCRIPLLTEGNIKDIIYKLTGETVDVKYYDEKEIELYSRIHILEKFTYRYNGIEELDALFDMLVKICEIKVKESEE